MRITLEDHRVIAYLYFDQEGVHHVDLHPRSVAAFLAIGRELKHLPHRYGCYVYKGQDFRGPQNERLGEWIECGEGITLYVPSPTWTR